MGKSQETFNKKEREKKRQKKKKEKAERREQRKLEKAESGKKNLEDLLSYVDEFGNVTSTPPDPNKRKKVIKAEDIVLGVPKKEHVEEDPNRSGKVSYFNDEKGFGFIIDHASNDRVFFHFKQLAQPVQEGDKVNFEITQGPKGLSAINITLA